MESKNALHLQHLASSVETEPTYYMQHQQSLAKMLSPGRYQHGVSRNKLFDYSYAPGDLIVCNRGIDEFVHWESKIQILKIDLPDEAFRAIAEEAGAESVEISSSTRFEDQRVSALIAAVQAEEDGGSLSGRLYLDSIAQALPPHWSNCAAISSEASHSTIAASRRSNCPGSSIWSTDVWIKRYRYRRWPRRQG